MITGMIVQSREARVRITVGGPSGHALESEAVIDTGFTGFLTLPPGVVSQLALPLVEVDDVMLADGQRVLVRQYRAQVDWDGRRLPVIVHCLDGTPLIGMSLLEGFLLTMRIVDNGPVTIRA